MDHKPRRITLENKGLLVTLITQISDVMALYKSKNDLFTFSKLADQSSNMVAIPDHTFNYE
ncbi:MAG: hypothetical protein ACJAZM_001311 [Cyclobacteriaceae bacterium]|jgi:hypothetical protein